MPIDIACIWTSPRVRLPLSSPFALLGKLFLGIFVALAPALLAVFVIAAAAMGQPDAVRAALLLIGVVLTTLALTLTAMRTGNAFAAATTLLFLDAEGALYVFDAHAVSAGRALSQLSRAPRLASAAFVSLCRGVLPEGARRIREVRALSASSSVRVLSCMEEAVVGGAQPAPATHILELRYEDDGMLARALDRLRQEDDPLRVRKSGERAVASGVLLAMAVALCVLSHPGVALLPKALYFPCLGIAFALVWVCGYFTLRHRRGF